MESLNPVAAAVLIAGVKMKNLIVWLYNHLGDPRTKNVIICVLLILCAFGMIAPQQATGLRDIVLSMPF